MSIQKTPTNPFLLQNTLKKHSLLARYIKMENDVRLQVKNGFLDESGMNFLDSRCILDIDHFQVYLDSQGNELERISTSWSIWQFFRTKKHTEKVKEILRRLRNKKPMYILDATLNFYTGKNIDFYTFYKCPKNLESLAWAADYAESEYPKKVQRDLKICRQYSGLIDACQDVVSGKVKYALIQEIDNAMPAMSGLCGSALYDEYSVLVVCKKQESSHATTKLKHLSGYTLEGKDDLVNIHVEGYINNVRTLLLGS